MKKILLTIMCALAPCIALSSTNCKKLTPIAGDITENTFIEVQAVVDCLDNNKETVLIINSGGGDVSFGFGTFDILYEHPKRKLLTTVAYGEVSSAAALIFLAGEKRLISCNSYVFVHEPKSSTSGDLSIKDVKERLASLTYSFDRMVKAQARVTGISESDMAKMLQNDTTLPAKEAVRLGFATGTTKSCD